MKKAKSTMLVLNGYPEFLGELKQRIADARLHAARTVNREMIRLYWDIGRAIVEKQQTLNWGDSVVELLAKDLRKAFPGMSGFSADNVWRMRQLFAEYTAPAFLEQLVPEMPATGKRAMGQFLEQAVPEMKAGRNSKRDQVLAEQRVADLVSALPWGHNLEILKKTSAPAARLYYLQATAQFGWSRNVLLNQIKAKAFERAKREKKAHNFEIVLPEQLAAQANEMLKSSYSLEFLGINRIAKERVLEDRLVEQLRDFILELGYGFCFVGRQHRLELGTREFFVDLLFYHRFLKALVAIDLKLGPFEPEHAGKMDFYRNLLNEKERGPEDQPSIGIILCAEKDELVVEFSLKTKSNPIGVAEYQLTDKLPKEFKGKLPSVGELRMALLPDKTVSEKPKRK